MKKSYNPINVTVELLDIEHAIAAGSATVTPLNATSQVREEWEVGTDVVGEQVW